MDAEPPEEWTPLHELYALGSAGTPEEFRLCLILTTSSGGRGLLLGETPLLGLR